MSRAGLQLSKINWWNTINRVRSQLAKNIGEITTAVQGKVTTGKNKVVEIHPQGRVTMGKTFPMEYHKQDINGTNDQVEYY